MEIPKDMILDFLRERGQSDQAEQAERELPDQVDVERDSSLLGRFGLDPNALKSMVGDRLPGGIADKLGF